MAIYTIGDLHLSLNSDKPMDIFGENWLNHHTKIEEDWYKNVSNSDTVIIPGDISWASSLVTAMDDLNWIEKLPGKKLLLRGNHDYWWSTLSKMRKLFKTIDFIQNNHYEVEDKIICGTRGWVCPNDTIFTADDNRIYLREIERLKLSLNSVGDNDKEKIVFLHYPPINDKNENSLFVDTLKEYRIKKVYYGHIHTSFSNVLVGEKDGIEYNLVSCDYLDFKLKKVE